MASVNKKTRTRRQRRLKELWKDRMYIVKGGLRHNLAKVQPLYSASLPACLDVCLYALLAKQYAHRSGIREAEFNYLMAAIVTRDITGRLTFKSDTPLLKKFNRQILRQLQNLHLIFKTHANAGSHGRTNPAPATPGKKIKGSYYYYTVSPLGISIAADFRQVCTEYFETLRQDPDNPPEVETFINSYFLREAGKL